MKRNPKLDLILNQCLSLTSGRRYIILSRSKQDAKKALKYLRHRYSELLVDDLFPIK